MRKQGSSLANALLITVFLGFTAGCGNHAVRVAVPKSVEETPISFLKDGQTTKREVTSRLGGKHEWVEDDGTIVFMSDGNDRIKVVPKREQTPMWEFEDGRILVYALDKKYRVAASANKARFHLTLVFDEINKWILNKHNLVRVR